MDATRINIVSGIGGREVPARVGPSTEKAVAGERPADSTVEDIAELSPAGIALSRADVQSRLRIAQISEIRAELKAGAFLTPERVDGTVDRLLDMFG